MNHQEPKPQERHLSPVSGATGARLRIDRESLLLAPMDSAAESAVSHALSAGGFSFRRENDVLMLDLSRSDLPALNALIDAHLPRTLQRRIKGVFAGTADNPGELLGAFLRAEVLPIFFEQAEVAWAEEALEQGWLYSVFQPIVCADSGAEHGFEALIRARNPQTGEIISAGQLIHACERLNIQHQLDQQARACAIRHAATLQSPDARFFINFFPNSVYDPEASLRNTLDLAEANGIRLSQLVFEVVEREQIDSPTRLRQILDYYRSKGAGIALDDIGSGFSSLHYLADLMPDYVKIDRHIVSGAADQVSARHTLESIVGLARKLNVKVIAEGIETPEEMRICVEAGVDFLQGFLFAVPAYPPGALQADVFRMFKKAA